MQLSRFVLTYRDVRPGEHVLYDVIKDHYVGVDDATVEALSRWHQSPPKEEQEREVHDALRAEGFLVEGSREDDLRLRAFLENAAPGMPGTMYITIIPTLICNLACNYCFQKDHPSFTKMTDPVEASTVEWILRRVDAAASRKLLVHYFGGEPLTRKDLLLRTAEIFSSAMSARGGEFEWEITTNGVGLSVELVNTMLGFGRGSIKVTLDGDKETHDAARIYRGGKGTFDEILAKMLAVTRACPTLNMRLGGNFKAEHVASYERLLDRLEAEGMAGLLESVRFKPVIDTDDKTGGTCTSCAQANAEAETLVQLKTSVERRGLSRESAQAGTPAAPCELHWRNSYIIDPEGLVYKCPAVAGMPKLAVNSVTAPPQVKDRGAPLLQLRPWEKCGPCPFMPVCMGGCLGGKYLQTGRMDEVFCKKTEFEKAFRAEVLGRYLDEFGSAEHHDADAASPEATTGSGGQHESNQDQPEAISPQDGSLPGIGTLTDGL
jgi:uncharacterized protein